MIRVWIRCFVLPSTLLREENGYRIRTYDGSILEGVSSRTTIVPTFSAALSLTTPLEQLAASNHRHAERAKAHEARRLARASGNKPVWPKKVKKPEEQRLLCVWGAVVAELLKEDGDRLIVALPDGKVVQVNSKRVLTRSDKTANATVQA